VGVIDDSLIRFFYPGSCPVCFQATEENGLCEGCAREVPLAHDLAPPDPLAGFPACAACRYAGVVRDLVLQLKFGRDPHPATALGELLAGCLAASGFARDADSLVPVPLSRRRLRQRGFNQAERIARVVGQRLGIPVIELLSRPLHRPPQADLGAEERARNVRGAFRGKDGAFGRAVLVLDDVITTGHTMAAAAAALEAAGARRVFLCAAAASGWQETLPALRSASGGRETP
jgi:competence protein ComFC